MNSRIPNGPSSRPQPLRFTPPKGRRGSDATIPLTKTAPDSTVRASASPRGDVARSRCSRRGRSRSCSRSRRPRPRRRPAARRRPDRTSPRPGRACRRGRRRGRSARRSSPARRAAAHRRGPARPGGPTRRPAARARRAGRRVRAGRPGSPDRADRRRAAPRQRCAKPLLELVGDRLGDEEALGGDARLAGVLVACTDGGRRGRRHVGVGEDDVRVRAAQLEHRLLERAPAIAATRAPTSELPVSVTARTRRSRMTGSTAAPGSRSVRKSPRGKPPPRTRSRPPAHIAGCSRRA